MYNVTNPTEHTVVFLSILQSGHEVKARDTLETMVGQTMFSEKLSWNKHIPKFQALDCFPNKGAVITATSPNFKLRADRVRVLSGQAEPSPQPMFFSSVKKCSPAGVVQWLCVDP